MTNAWLFRFSVALTVAYLAILLTGVVVTDLVALNVPFSPITVPDALALHRHVAEVVGTLMLVLAVWVLFADGRAWGRSQVKLLSLAAVASLVVETMLGMGTVPLPQGTAFFHALLSPLVFGTLVSVSVLLWPGWEREGTPLMDKGWPSLRSLSRNTVILIVIQIALGAAFRHNLVGVLWHILGAFVVVVFGVGLLVLLTQTPGGESLKPAVVTLGVLLGVQITLGMVLISISDQSKHPELVLYSTAAHVLTGASVFAVTILLAMLIRRSPRGPQAA